MCSFRSDGTWNDTILGVPHHWWSCSPLGIMPIVESTVRHLRVFHVDSMFVARHTLRSLSARPSGNGLRAQRYNRVFSKTCSHREETQNVSLARTSNRPVKQVLRLSSQAEYVVQANCNRRGLGLRFSLLCPSLLPLPSTLILPPRPMSPTDWSASWPGPHLLCNKLSVKGPGMPGRESSTSVRAGFLQAASGWAMVLGWRP